MDLGTVSAWAVLQPGHGNADETRRDPARQGWQGRQVAPAAVFEASCGGAGRGWVWRRRGGAVERCGFRVHRDTAAGRSAAGCAGLFVAMCCQAGRAVARRCRAWRQAAAWHNVPGWPSKIRARSCLARRGQTGHGEVWPGLDSELVNISPGCVTALDGHTACGSFAALKPLRVVGMTSPSTCRRDIFTDSQGSAWHGVARRGSAWVNQAYLWALVGPAVVWQGRVAQGRCAHCETAPPGGAWLGKDWRGTAGNA